MSRRAGTLCVMGLLALMGCGKGESDSYRRQLCWATRHALGATGASGDIEAAMKALQATDAQQGCAKYNQLLLSARSLIKGSSTWSVRLEYRPEVVAVSDALRIRDGRSTCTVDEELQTLMLESSDRLAEFPKQNGMRRR